MPAFDSDRYQDYVRNGDRSRFQSLNSKRWSRLRELVLGECLEGKGRFTKAIEETVRGLCGDPSWLLPAHDRGAGVFHGGEPYVDLAVAMNGHEMALTAWLLEDRLSGDTVRLLRSEVSRRLTQPVFKMINGTASPEMVRRQWWATADNNWNAVCTAGAIGAILATEDSREVRAKAIEWALRNMDDFLSGFGTEGYCSEGVGYWSYGFGHYLVLAELIRDQTGGKVDLYAGEQVRKVASAVTQLEIADNLFPAFADCSLESSPDPLVLDLVRWRLDRQPFPGDAGGILAGASTIYQTLVNLNARRGAPVRGETADAPLPLRSWFAKSGVCVVRPSKPGALAAAWKGGHNDEHHNHNDVGSTVVAWKGKPLLADIGSMVYRAETFSSERYHLTVHSSFGHPVPVPNGMLQAQGRAAAAKVVATDFSDARDSLTMDLVAAYPGAGLRKLERQWTYSRTGDGQLVVEDRFEFSKPAPFATALVGLGEWRLLEKHKQGARFSLKAEGGATLEVAAECSGPPSWEVCRIENPGKESGHRLGLALADASPAGFIRMTIRPAGDGAPTGETLPVRSAPRKLTDPRRAP